MRTITGTVLVTFGTLVLQPAIAAAQTEIKRAEQAALTTPTDEDELSEAVIDIETKLQQLNAKLAAGKPEGNEREALKSLHKKIEALDKKALAHFAEIEKKLNEKKLPPEILQRHQDAVATYRRERDTLFGHLQAVDSAKTAKALKTETDKAAKHLSSKKLKRAQQPFDPNNLPNQSLKPNEKNKPKQKKEDFTRAGLHNTPLVKVAALGNFRYDTLSGASDPAYLAQSTEVLITQAIQDQAAALNHDPVKIYHWVRNNVDWIPTWGAMQDADLTLSSKRGNSLDIASLTIALLRASGIPARYVHGTIEIPADKFRNWTGGFDTIEAALGFASSGWTEHRDRFIGSKSQVLLQFLTDFPIP